MLSATIDLNADLAEGYGRWSFGTDEGLLEIVTSANVACGFHAGDPTVIRDALRGAARQGTRIGAHVGYPDLVGFGRRYLAMSGNELVDAVAYQLAALDGLARAAGTEVSYVKPHGALYHQVMVDEESARAVVRAIVEVDPGWAVTGMPHSAFLNVASSSALRTWSEGFADRAYAADGTLVPRGVEGAVIAEPVTVAARTVRMVTEHRVDAIDGSTLEINVDSICLHGDSPGAVTLARSVRSALVTAGIDVRAPSLA